jgi:hypothetical protein
LDKVLQEDYFLQVKYLSRHIQIEGDKSSLYNLSYKGSISFQTDSTANFLTEPAEMTNKTIATNSRENSSVLSVNEEDYFLQVKYLVQHHFLQLRFHHLLQQTDPTLKLLVRNSDMTVLI